MIMQASHGSTFDKGSFGKGAIAGSVAEIDGSVLKSANESSFEFKFTDSARSAAATPPQYGLRMRPSRSWGVDTAFDSATLFF